MKYWILIVLLVAGTAHAAINSYPRLEYQAPGMDNGEILIDFENDSSISGIVTLLGKLGLKSSQYSWFSEEERWLRVRNISSDLWSRLRGNSNIEGVEPNYYMTAFSVPNDPYYKYQWHLDLIQMKEAWDFPQGAPVTVAVIDTGIAFENYQDHFVVEDLKASQFVHPYNFIAGNEHANDDHGHGTHVAGTIAQLTNNGIGVAGVAPQVRLMPLKVLNSGGYGTISDIAAAIRYAADNGASVINMSLGGPFPSRILHRACEYAYRKGVVIVCAAGNSGRSGISYPAKYPECISVSAVRYDGTLTWYSSYGAGLTIAAPGGDTNVDQNGDGLMDGVLQNTLNPQDPTQQGYFLFQGTSMAAPHVAAAAALLVSHGITDPDAVRRQLQKSAHPVPGGSAEQYGAGILDVQKALQDAYLVRRGKIFLLGLCLLIALIQILNRGRMKVEKIRWGAGTILGLIFGSTGLFFLAMISSHLNPYLLTHSFSEWPEYFFGIGQASNPITFSAVPALLVVLICYPWKRMVGFAMGLTVGIAASLLFMTFSPVQDLAWIPGSLLESSWLFVHAVFCILLAAIVSFRLR